MKDFFENQETARRKTGQLIFFFVLAIILIVICVYMAVTGIYILTFSFELDPLAAIPFWDPGRLVLIAIITLLVILGGSLYKINSLRDGGCRVAEMLGGRLIPPGTDRPEERRLLNVVEEMSIASGVPVPDVYVMDNEGGINAFAAGFNIEDSVICVTKGSLSLLNRDELQGVIAHEFSHVFNGDASINISLLSWLHGILLLSLIGEGILRGMGRLRSRGSMPVAVLGIALYVLGYIGLFFGRLIKSAVSRQREYLADASAVQYTRNPSALAAVLKKIGGLIKGSHILHPRVSEASHMYFCNGLNDSLFAIMDTHPPLINRILRLDPHFDGVFPEVHPLPAAGEPAAREYKPALQPAAEVLPVITGAAAMSILETVGAPMREHMELVRNMLDGLPGSIRDAVRDPSGACALIYVLLLDRSGEIREKQMDLLRSSVTPDVAAETEKLAEYLPSLASRVRLPLADMAIPSLRSLSEKQYDAFRENFNMLIDADEQVSLLEHVLRYLVFRNLDARFIKSRRKTVQIYSVRGVTAECSYVLSMLAHTGQRDEEAAVAAFNSGKRILLEPALELNLLPSEECTLDNLDGALNALAVASPLIKKKLLAACLECLTFDKTVEVQEVELFRAVADALGCPVPPWLAL